MVIFHSFLYVYQRVHSILFWPPSRYVNHIGRAGRDGFEARCVLLYSVLAWQSGFGNEGSAPAPKRIGKWYVVSLWFQQLQDLYGFMVGEDITTLRMGETKRSFELGVSCCWLSLGRPIWVVSEVTVAGPSSSKAADALRESLAAQWRRWKISMHQSTYHPKWLNLTTYIAHCWYVVVLFGCWGWFIIEATRWLLFCWSNLFFWGLLLEMPQAGGNGRRGSPGRSPQLTQIWVWSIQSYS